jgi:hypothetical protein
LALIEQQGNGSPGSWRETQIGAVMDEILGIEGQPDFQEYSSTQVTWLVTVSQDLKC